MAHVMRNRMSAEDKRIAKMASTSDLRNVPKKYVCNSHEYLIDLLDRLTNSAVIDNRNSGVLSSR